MLNHSNNNRIAGPICEKLESHELHELSIEDKIAVLELLQSRILELDVVSSFIDEYQREVCEAYKKKVVDTKDFNDKLKAVRLTKQGMCRLMPLLANGGLGAAEGVPEQPQQSQEAVEEASQVMRRRQSIEQKLKESEEKERRLEKERQYQRLEKEEQGYRKSLEQCQRSYTTAISDAKQLMRVQPLGTDRHFRRYWHFATAPGALYVETELDSADSDTKSTSWKRFISADEVVELIGTLCEKGIRESLLRLELEAVLPKLREEMELVVLQEAGSTATVAPPTATELDSFLVAGFKQELQETEMSVRQGSLGGVEDYAAWKHCIEDAAHMGDMKQALVAVFLGVHDRFWSMPLKSAAGRAEFLAAVEDARTQGRLNVLQSFLDASVCWSKSAKDDKCRVCRKNSDESAMLLCDSCNHAFHTFCLRPPLIEVPDGEWFCPHCKPVSRAKDPETATDAIVDSKPKSKTRNGGAAHVEQCCVCHAPNATDQLAKCTSCKKCFHAQCHEPALRQIRRTNWHCCECRLDEVALHKTRHSGGPRAKNGVEEDDEQDDSDDKEKEREKLKVAKRPGRKPSVNNGVPVAKVNGVRRKKTFHEVEQPDEPEEKHVHKRARVAVKESDSKKSDQEESDQDLENLSSLFARRRGRRRTSNDDGSNGATPIKKARASGSNGVATPGTPTLEKTEKACQSMLNKLLHHKASWPFRQAVDPEEVPDYYQIVSDPMDLLRMSDKNKCGAYRGGLDALKQFLGDVGQIFYNAELYNLPDSKVMGLALQLEEFFKGVYGKYDFGVEYSRLTNEEEEDDDE